MVSCESGLYFSMTGFALDLSESQVLCCEGQDDTANFGGTKVSRERFAQDRPLASATSSNERAFLSLF